MLRDGRSFGFEPQGEHSFDKASQWLSVNKQKGSVAKFSKKSILV